MKATLSTDGGSRGNPGPAAYAYVLEAEDGTVLAAHGEAIGVATNNVAEYSALVAGLKKALELHVPEVEVVSDSELLVKQMRGEYRVKNEALRALFVEASTLARGLDTDDVVFRSPAVHKQYHGKEQVAGILRLVATVFENFRYTTEWRDDATTILFFEANVGDRELQGVDILEENDAGLVERFTVMIRPLSGLQAVAAAMAAKLST